MRRPYPVHFDVVAPADRYDRAQLALRLVVGALLGMLGLSVGGLALLTYLVLPAAAAVLVSRDGPEAFSGRDAPVLARWVHWLMAAAAYFTLVTDRLPADRASELVYFEVTAMTRPTVASALMRLLKTIPAALLLSVLMAVGCVVWLIAAGFILVRRQYPGGFRGFLLGVLRYQARVLAYHASLVDLYPPFDLDAAEPSVLAS